MEAAGHLRWRTANRAANLALRTLCARHRLEQIHSRLILLILLAARVTATRLVRCRARHRASLPVAKHFQEMSWRPDEAARPTPRCCAIRRRLFCSAFPDFFVQQRLLFLRDADWVLPQARIDVLRSDYWSGLFARNRRAFAHEWLVLGDDSSEHRQKGSRVPQGKSNFRLSLSAMAD